VTRKLHRYYGAQHLHFITCSCYHRQPILGTPERRDRFVNILEETRSKYRFVVHGYVVMPEHFHLLTTEPEIGDPSVVMKVIKERFSKQVHALEGGGERQTQRGGCPTHRGFCDVWATAESELALKVPPQTHPNPDPTKIWQKRFYDFNVWSAKKHAEKLEYIHSNPVKRGLVERPEDWPWSSFRHYQTGEQDVVEIESHWTASKREKTGPRLHSSDDSASGGWSNPFFLLMCSAITFFMGGSIGRSSGIVPPMR
jgi:putative transposase